MSPQWVDTVEKVFAEEVSGFWIAFEDGFVRSELGASPLSSGCRVLQPRHEHSAGEELQILRDCSEVELVAGTR